MKAVDSEILERIERTRKKLNEKYCSCNGKVNAKELMDLSCKMDRLIARYCQLLTI